MIIKFIFIPTLYFKYYKIIFINKKLIEYFIIKLIKVFYIFINIIIKKINFYNNPFYEK
jgi:hypothetical protein